MSTRSTTLATRSSTRTKSNQQPSLAPAAPPPRTTRATASRAASKATAQSSIGASSKLTARKPLVGRENSLPQSQPTPNKRSGKSANQPENTGADDGDREPIRAFLRIRPKLGDDESSSTPYLKFISSTSVQMSDQTSSSSRFRLHPGLKSIYTFSHVFLPETRQVDFFSRTTLPLVNDLLNGRNGLVFTYGVTNSGKTYTIEGGTEPKAAGLLPRTLDVVFNSLDDLHGDASYRPVRFNGVERASDQNSQESQFVLPDATFISNILAENEFHQDSDTTSLRVDRNYEYSVWISYAEVYNEKVFDLLSDTAYDDVLTSPTGLPRSTSTKKLPRSTSTWQTLASLPSSSSGADVLLVKRKALALKSDPDGGKYVAGLRELRVRTADEAKAAFRTGKANRRVFGTLANTASSRSHGIFTIKIIKVHKGLPDDINSVTSSRLSIVDLAGSERSKNTHNTGERLKEAGNINKSLMVLGQCMEALRNNQRRQAASLAAPGRGSLRPFDSSNGVTAMKMGIVPFRHSKLTELFQDFFLGEHEGRAVMIVNVNPYDTGYDENSHVMRFAALAREVTTNITNPSASTPIKQRSGTGIGSSRPASHSLLLGAANHPTPLHSRKVTISTGGAGGRKISEAHLEVVEEDEEIAEDETDDPINPFVDALFDEIENLRVQLYESDMRCAIIEAETREEVMREMEKRMMNMERMFTRRLMNELEQNEVKTDAKIDMLQQFGILGNREKMEGSSRSGIAEEVYEDYSSEDLEDDVEGVDEREDTDKSNTDEDDMDHRTETESACSIDERSLRMKVSDDGPDCIGLRDEEMGIDDFDADETETDEEGGNDDDHAEGRDNEDEDEPSVTEDDDDEDNYDDWSPSSEGSFRSSQSEIRTEASTTEETSSLDEAKAPQQQLRGLSEIREKMDIISLEDGYGTQGSDKSAAVQRVARKVATPRETKRQLRKRT